MKCQLEMEVSSVQCQSIRVQTTVDNLLSVFKTIAKRPQLLFDSIKYCDVTLDLEFDETDEIPFEKLAASENMLKNCVEIKGGGHLISAESWMSNSEHSIIGVYTVNSFVVLNVKCSGTELSSFLRVTKDDSSIQIELYHIPWKENPCVLENKLSKLSTWLTTPGFLPKSPSNSLVNQRKYYWTYCRLKDQYAEKITSSWDMQTDPEKFVHEDIGIASYLICLWEDRYGAEEARQYVNFVDIGCGNGLLVYLLNQEKFEGFGIDVKARKIWSTALSSSKYIESFFDPKNWEMLSEYNWLIGNHSDELTPWIPYVATMISYNCQFFLLPCCLWNFTEKYRRTDPKLSSYQCYLNHIRTVIAEFGFESGMDTMKIPSTKRTCFVSSQRSYSESDYKMRVQSTLDTVRAHSGSNTNCVARAKEIKVRNGTKIDKSLCQRIVNYSAEILTRKIDKNDPVWSTGDEIPLRELVGLIKDHISFEDELKEQAGGVQTILRNSPQIFVIRNGIVRLRDWSKDAPRTRNSPGRKYDSAALVKTKLCWFNEYHPQGCNLSIASCRYAHGSDDLSAASQL